MEDKFIYWLSREYKLCANGFFAKMGLHLGKGRYFFTLDELRKKFNRTTNQIK